MILIRKNNQNTVALSLSNNVTLSATSVYFLFEFENPQTRESVLFTANDTSNNPYRYNKFNIIETGSTDVNLTGGTINLEPEGWWNYNVYQMLDPTNLSLSAVTGGPIENGKVYVTGSTVANGQQTIYTGENESRIVYYNG